MQQFITRIVLVCCVSAGLACFGQNANSGRNTQSRPPLIVVTDESWEASSEPVEFGEYAMSAQQLPQPFSPLKGGTKPAVEAAYFEESTIIPGTKPIWRTPRVGDGWEACHLRRRIVLDNQPLKSVFLTINCDDAARLYINQRLVSPEKESTRLKNARGGTSTFRELSAAGYNEIKTYDVTDYFFTGVTNTVIVEVANQPYWSNHAYLSARIVLEFMPLPEPPRPAVAAVPKKTPPKTPLLPAAKPASPQPEVPKPAKTETAVFNSGSMIAVEKLRVGSILELGNVYFKPDDYKLDSLSYQTLSALVSFLKTNPTLEIEVAGHTNLLAGGNFSRTLSENRARSVATYLTNNGIAPKRITYKGYGKDAPKVPGTSKEANRQNQRVELKVTAR